jgi:hypothetical protein
MYEFLADWQRDGFRAPLGTGFGRYLIERKISMCTAPIAHTTTMQSAIDENGDLEHEA